MKTGKSRSKKDREPWNGRDFYISFGEGDVENNHVRSWNDARHYGFVSGGGGKWYTQTLSLLFPGARVFVNLPGKGYVGVGVVKENACPIKDFLVEVEGQKTRILDAPLESVGFDRWGDDPEKSEHFVRVEWIKTALREEAYWEKGMFAVQHTACRMRSSFTIERLCKHFRIEE